MNKRLLLMSLLALFSIVFTTKKASASHAAGAEIIYVHIADSTYQFFFKFYRDCSGINRPPDVDLCFFNTCTNQKFSVPMSLWQGTLPPDNRPNGSPVSAGCSQYETNCTTGTLPGYEEYWYSCIAQLPLKCNYWKFAAWISARNPQNNIMNAVGGNFNLYVETTFNSSFTWGNSSPYYSVKPIPYVCLNRPYSFNNGAIDSDGDSLYHIMVNPLAYADCEGTPTPAQPRPMTPAINFNNNPLQTNSSFNLNGINGQMNFTATLAGAATISMLTTEYYTRGNTNDPHYGDQIGSIMRDVQVQVLACSVVQPTLDTVSITNGGFQNDRVYGCVNEKLDFCFEVSSSDTDAILLAEDNLNIAIPGATMTYTNLRTDTIKGCFEWTPTINDVGDHSFIVVIKDSTCKPPGILLQYSKIIDLTIWGPVETSADTSICSGESAFLGVTGGGNYQWSVVSGTDPSLNNPNIATPIATPTEPTVYAVVSKANEYCPNLNKDTVTIDVLKGPEITGQPDDTTCPGYPIQLNAGLVNPDPNVTYTVTWSPATGLNNPTIASPTATLQTPQTYYLSVGSSVNRCNTLDTAVIDVLTGFKIENPDTAICDGESVDVRGTGDPRYSYEWKPGNPNLNPTINNPGDIEATITPGTVGKDKYVLHATYYKCLGVDSTAEFEIELQPIPTVTVNDDENLCYGDTMQLDAIVTPAYSGYSYDWTPGEALDFPERSNPIFSAIIEGVTKLTATVSTSAGCTGSDEIELNVFAAEFIFVPNDTAICAGESIVLTTTADEGVKYYWGPDFNISSVSSLSPEVWPVTDQTYYAYGVDSLGCLDTASVNIEVHARAIMDMPDSVTIYPGEGFRMDPGGNCLYYSWFPHVGLSNSDVSNPMVSPDVNTRYIIQGRTEAGCTVTDSLDVFVKNDSQFDVPNAFTPGRRNNGTLKVIAHGAVELKTFSIYNRWGTKVFETTDINEGWDGTYNGEYQPMGVYIYAVDGVATSGRTVNKQGNVTLIR